MNLKNIKFIFILGLFTTTFANQSSIDDNVLKSLQSNDVQILEHQIIEKNTDGTDFVTTINLIPKSEKNKIIQEKIAILKKDIAAWKVKRDEIIKLKQEFEDKINKNDADIRKFKEDIEKFNKTLGAFEVTMKNDLEDIDIGKKLIEVNTSEVITVSLSNGKKIRLIKYIIFPGDTLSKILIRTLPENSESKTSLSYKIETVIKLNKNIKNANTIKAGDIIYIPFFK